MRTDSTGSLFYSKIELIKLAREASGGKMGLVEAKNLSEAFMLAYGMSNGDNGLFMGVNTLHSFMRLVGAVLGGKLEFADGKLVWARPPEVTRENIREICGL